MSWLQIHLIVDREQAPLAALLFDQQGALSVTYQNAGNRPLLEPLPGTTPLWPQIRVTGLFPGDCDLEMLATNFSRLENQGLATDITYEMLEDQPWERSWMDRFHPMRFGERLWVCPTGQTVEQPDAVTVSLDPGLAFGTGSHPTTALCLEWLERTELEGRLVLDLGCGSGILAIAALKLGAQKAIAVDHDPQALQVTNANAEKNGVGNRIELRRADTLDHASVDYVVSNILAGTLINMERRLADLTKPGGEIALSGILREQAGQVRAAFAEHFTMAAPGGKNEWVLLEGRRH